MVQRLTLAPAAVLLTLTLTLAGCVTMTGYPTSSQPPAPAGGPTDEQQPPVASMPAPAPEVGAPPVTAAPRPDPAVSLALREESLQAAGRGDTAEAIALIERAIRIEPDRPELWIDLARLHLEEGDAAAAEQFARKALLYTRNRHDLEQQAYLVIAEAQHQR
jgi:hypothetical protein